MASLRHCCKGTANLLQLSDGEWWITGGENGNESSDKLLEFRSDGNPDAPDLPQSFDDHSAVRIGDDTVFLTNGQSTVSWIFARSGPGDDGGFERVEAEQSVERFQGMAGLIRKADGTRQATTTFFTHSPPPKKKSN